MPIVKFKGNTIPRVNSSGGLHDVIVVTESPATLKKHSGGDVSVFDNGDGTHDLLIAVGSGGTAQAFNGTTTPRVSERADGSVIPVAQASGDAGTADGYPKGMPRVFAHADGSHDICVVGSGVAGVVAGLKDTSPRYFNFADNTFGILVKGFAEFFLNGVKIADLSAPITLAPGDNTITGTGTGTLSGVISGGTATSLTFALDAGSTLTLSGANTYTAPTTVSSGNVVFSNSWLTTGLSAASGAVLEINNSITRSVRNPTTISGNGVLRKTGIGLLAIGGPDYLATLAMTAGGLFDIRQGSVRCEYGYNKTSLAGNLGDLYVEAGAIFDVWDYGVNTGSSATFDKISGGGSINKNIGGASKLLVGVGNGSSVFNGIIANAAGTLSFTKNGTGTITLSGNNTYSGGTTINGGTLTAGRATAFGTGTITINAGATLNKAGFALANTIVNNGGTVIN